VKVIEIDGERRRLSLSLKRVEEDDPVQPRADGGESVHLHPNLDLSDRIDVTADTAPPIETPAAAASDAAEPAAAEPEAAELEPALTESSVDAELAADAVVADAVATDDATEDALPAEAAPLAAASEPETDEEIAPALEEE
jgi:small subunit ribosomal protein S1